MFKEARARVTIVAASFIACFVASYTYASEYLYLLTQPFAKSDPLFIFTSMNEALSATTQLCLLTSFLATLPLAAYNYWAFVVPSTFCNERRALTWRVARVVLLTYGAAAVSYALLPKMLDIMLTSSAPFLDPEGAGGAGGDGGGNVRYSARVDSYVQLAFRLLLVPPAAAVAAMTKLSLLNGGCMLLMFTGGFALAFEANVVWNLVKTLLARCKV